MSGTFVVARENPDLVQPFGSFLIPLSVEKSTAEAAVEVARRRGAADEAVAPARSEERIYPFVEDEFAEEAKVLPTGTKGIHFLEGREG